MIVMKRFITLLSGLLFVFALHAQDIPREATVKYQKKNQRALEYEVPYHHDVVEQAIENYMVKKGSKASKSRGFTVYKQVSLNDSGSEVGDLYFKVERKSRKDTSSVISVIPMKAGADPGVATTDGLDIEFTRTILESLTPSFQESKLAYDIKAQENLVGDSEKKLNRLKNNQEDMERKIKDLQDKLEDNKKDQEKMTREIEQQRSNLETLRSRQG